MSCAKSQISNYEIVNLMELLEMYAGSCWRMAGMLGQLVCYLEAASQGATLADKTVGQLGATLGEIGAEMQRLGMHGPVKSLHNIMAFLDENKGNVLFVVLRQRLAVLHERVIEELEGQLFLSIPKEVEDFYRQSEPLFGKLVEARFPQLTEDIFEAGKCLSLRRPTATVFHLMRVMESGLQAFGTKLNVALADEKNWQNILDEVNKKIRLLDHRLPETKKYAEASSHLYNVKVAWRNEVMHPKQTYTDEEALSIFRNVRTFIQDLAEFI